MSRFVLLDHSLEAVGGHHYETALHVLRAAQRIGFEILLATNQRFTARSELPAEWHVVSPFPDNAYVPEARIVPSPAAPAEPPTTGRFRSGIPGWPAQWPDWFTQRRRGRRTARRRLAHQQRFARACQQVFAGVDLERGDHVFLPTVNELDLAGLTWFLSQSPRLKNADWHLQFHFDYLPDQRPAAESFERMQLEFRTALSRAAGFRLHFYTTTRQLSQRYRRLRVASFHTLPYPLNPAFLQPNEWADERANGEAAEHADERAGEQPTASQPLRVLLAGGVRPEKGQQNLATVIEQLWDDYLAQGRLQLQVQGQPEDLERLLPGHLAGGKLPRQSSSSASGCILVPHPLPADDYVQLIRRADLGLLLYDARRYRHRRAGVLCELLCSGVPVIVPAECWLADELTEWIQSHRQEVVERMPTLAEWRGSRLDSSTSSGHPRRGAEHYVGGAGAGLVVQVPAPQRATQVALSFRLPPDESGEHYVRVDVEQFDDRRRRLAGACEILGARAGAAPLWLLANLVPGASRVRLQIHSTDEQQCLRITDMGLRFGGTGASSADGALPLGAVGLVAARVGEVGRLVSDMVRHYPHYRRTAQQFARATSTSHEPATTLRCLLAHGAPAVPPAAALRVETDLALTREIPDICRPAASRPGPWAQPVAPRANG